MTIRQLKILIKIYGKNATVKDIQIEITKRKNYCKLYY